MSTTIYNAKRLKNGLIKKFHTLLCVQGLGREAKEGILASYGVEHTNELSISQLQEAVRTLEDLGKSPQERAFKDDMDKWRKRAIAAAFAMARELGYTMSIEGAKAMVLRATGNEYASFNKIPQRRLQGIYNGFTANTRDMREAVRVGLELRIES